MNNNKVLLIDKLIWIVTVMFMFMTMTVSLILGDALGPIVLLVLLLILFVLSIIRNKLHMPFGVSVFHIYVLTFGLICLASVCWAANRSLAFNKAIDIFEIFVMIVVFYWCYKDESNVDRMLSAVMWMDYLVVFYSVFYYGWGTLVYLLNSNARVSNDAINANSLGMAAAYAILINLYFLLCKKVKWWSVLMLPALIVLAVSGSKKAFLIMVIGVFILVFFNNKRDANQINRMFKKLVLLAAMLVLAVIIFNLPMFADIRMRFVKMLNAFSGSGKSDNSTLARLELIKIGFELFKKSPFIGVGADNAQVYTEPIFGFSGYYLHNNYIEILADVGLIGFCIYYWMYALILYRFVKYRNFQSKEYVITLIILLLRLIMDVAMVSYYSKNTYFNMLLLFIESNKLKNSIMQV